MGVKNELNGESSTRYYRWDARAYRIHQDERGDLTADIHPAGSDEVSISASGCTPSQPLAANSPDNILCPRERTLVQNFIVPLKRV